MKFRSAKDGQWYDTRWQATDPDKKAPTEYDLLLEAVLEYLDWTAMSASDSEPVISRLDALKDLVGWRS